VGKDWIIDITKPAHLVPIKRKRKRRSSKTEELAGGGGTRQASYGKTKGERKKGGGRR